MTRPHLSRSRRFLEQARAYADAAAALGLGGVAPAVLAPYFMLVAHSAELALKAVIADGDDDDEQLIRLGHDLPLCLRCAIDGGLDVDAAGGAIAGVIGELAMPHLAQTLRYPAYLAWRLPEPDGALDALTALLGRVESALNASPALASEQRPAAAPGGAAA